MDEKRLAKINTDALDEEAFAYGILSGESDNYDGADGARTVRKLCGYIGELIAAMKAQQAQMEDASKVFLDTRERLTLTEKARSTVESDRAIAMSLIERLETQIDELWKQLNQRDKEYAHLQERLTAVPVDALRRQDHESGR